MSIPANGDEALCLPDPLDLAYEGWVLIANVSGGNWEEQSDEWRDAAIRWRDRFHAALDAHLGSEPSLGVCGRCGRETWAADEVGTEDRMPQPDGFPCGGMFAARVLRDVVP